MFQTGNSVRAGIRSNDNNELIFKRGSDTTGMVLTSTGLGIGTTSPGRQLQINGDSDTMIRVVSSSGGLAGIQFGDADDSVMGGVSFDASDESLQLKGFNNSECLRNDSSGNVGVKTTNPQAPFVVSNSGADGIEMGYSSGSSSNYLQSYNRSTSAFARLDVVGNPLTFKTGSGATERMRIDSSGNVAIGTTSASSILTAGTGSGTNAITINGSASSTSVNQLITITRSSKMSN